MSVFNTGCAWFSYLLQSTNAAWHATLGVRAKLYSDTSQIVLGLGHATNEFEKTLVKSVICK